MDSSQEDKSANRSLAPVPAPWQPGVDVGGVDVGATDLGEMTVDMRGDAADQLPDDGPDSVGPG